MSCSVIEAEVAFVEGSFHRALSLANACLEQANVGQSSDIQNSVDESDSHHANETNTLILKTIIEIPLLVKKPSSVCFSPLRIRVRLGRLSAPDDIDRAAAVVLQSWYEISLLAKSDDRSNLDYGYTLLQSFFNAYSHKSRSLPLELTVIFIQFCQKALGQTHEPLELAFEIVYQVLSSADLTLLLSENIHYDENDDIDDWSSLQQLLNLILVQKLPYCPRVNLVTNALRRFVEPHWRPLSTKWNFVSNMNDASTANDINWDAVQEVVRFLDNPPIHWPDQSQKLLVQCRSNLEHDLRAFSSSCLINTTHLNRIDSNLSQQQEESHFLFHTPQKLNRELTESFRTLSSTDILSRAGSPTKQISMSPSSPTFLSRLRDAQYQNDILPTLGWDGSFRQCYMTLLHRISVLVVEPLFSSPQRWEHRKSVAIMVWSLYVLFKHRRKLFHAIFQNLKLLFLITKRPIQELMEAVVGL